MKTFYIYDPNSGIYLNEYNAQESPLEPGEYIKPDNSTPIPPLLPMDKKAVCFNVGADEWVYKLDYRGTWYQPDRSPVEITEINVAPDADWMLEPAPATIPELITDRLASINENCELAIAQISSGYPASEVLSWPKQETEARAWQANNSAATPLIDALASARGIVKADLVGRIIAKADAFAQESGQLIGKRQGLEDQLMSMMADFEDPELDDPTPAEIEAVVW